MKQIKIMEHYDSFITDDDLRIIHVFTGSTNPLIFPERLSRIWNEVNPQEFKASFFTDALNNTTGWYCQLTPHKDKEPTDESIYQALIEIFESTGRIVINAPEPNAFILTKDEQIICFDVKHAIRMTSFGEPHLAKINYRRASIGSAVMISKDYISSILTPYQSTFPRTVNTIKALLFIRINRPRVFELNVLIPEPTFAQFIAKAFDNPSDLALNSRALNFLDKITVPGRLFIGSGAYNRAYLCPDEKTVRKIQKHPTVDNSDSPDRIVRIWNELNLKLTPPAQIVDEKTSEFPFIERNKATDSEIAKELIDIFNNTGRIVLDAPSPGNFLKTTEGSVICVDVGMALQLDGRTEVFSAPKLIRRHSKISFNVWENNKHLYPSYWGHAVRTHPRTVHTIMSLLFIKENRPDIFDVSFLNDNIPLITLLARAYGKIDKKSSYDEELATLDAAVAAAGSAVASAAP